MSKTYLIGLMLATFSVSVSLAVYSDYEQRNNVVASEEVIAAYFKKKFETEG